MLINTVYIDISIVKETNVSDPRIISTNPKIHGFNNRLVNVYSPAKSNNSENKRGSLYMLINKACQKQEKHEKLIVIGDFNTKTSLAFKKCCYDRTNVVPDDDCNNSDTRLKTPCTSNRLYIASKYLDYPNENIYTWYNCNKKPRKNNEYVLTTCTVQQYVREYIVKPEIDLYSDHRILITSLYTPMTRKVSRRPKQKVKTKPLNLKSLKNTKTNRTFVNAVENYLQNHDGGSQ